MGTGLLQLARPDDVRLLVEARRRIAEIIDVMLEDDRNSWQLGADAEWRRSEDLNSAEGTRDTFAEMKAKALESGVIAAAPRRPGSGVGSMDPRA